MPKLKLSCTINGESRSFEAFPMERLLDVLREQIHLTGTKEGCGEGECGACSIFLNGQLVNSCLVPAAQANGAEIQTIEGIKNNPIQEAFIRCGGAQCGICTPGMIMASVNLVRQNPEPTEGQIRQGLAGNLCRCTGYTKIFDSVREGAKACKASRSSS